MIIGKRRILNINLADNADLCFDNILYGNLRKGLCNLGKKLFHLAERISSALSEHLADTVNPFLYEPFTLPLILFIRLDLVFEKHNQIAVDNCREHFKSH